MCQSLFFNKVVGLRPETIQKETLAKVNFVKFLRTPSLQNTSGRLLHHISMLHRWVWKFAKISCCVVKFYKTENDFCISAKSQVPSLVTYFNPSRPNPERREKIKLNFYFYTSLWCLKSFYKFNLMFISIQFSEMHETLRAKLNGK